MSLETISSLQIVLSAMGLKVSNVMCSLMLICCNLKKSLKFLHLLQKCIFSGEISILSQLNRENKARHTLVIEASDGVQTSSTRVIITVTDVNDSPPVFDKSLYTFDVPEDTAVGTTLGRVEAVDEDEGVNGEVFYTILSTWGSDLFTLDLNKGTFTLRGNLDFEQVTQFLIL